MQRSVTPATKLIDRSGAHHAWRMHLTTWILLILSPVALGLFVWLAGKDHAVVVDALARPYVALPLGFLVLISIWHMVLGMRTILEDYVRRPATFRALSGLSILFGVTVFAASAWALVQISLGL